MSFVPEKEQPKIETAAKPAVKTKEAADVVAFIDHYLALADTLLVANVEKQHSQEKSEPYVDRHEKMIQSAGSDPLTPND